MRQLKAEGGCLCRAIRYQIDGPLLGAAACHCRDCQYVSGGAPAYVIAVPEKSLTITKGKPARFTSMADSGAKRIREFCGTCGTPLFAHDAAYPDVVTIKAGSLDDPSLYKPEAEFWTASAPPWHIIDPKLRVFAKGPDGG